MSEAVPSIMAKVEHGAAREQLKIYIYAFNIYLSVLVDIFILYSLQICHKEN